jgi:hypothetical protein
MSSFPNLGVGAPTQMFEDVRRNDEANMMVFVSHLTASFFMSRDIVIETR